MDKLTSAAASGDLSQVRSIVDSGRAWDGRDGGGKTALISASKNGHKEVIELLLAMGADINSRGKYRQERLDACVGSRPYRSRQAASGQWS